MSMSEQNRLLKKALLGLNRKLVESRREMELLFEQRDRCLRENESLKLQNRFLLDK